MSKKLKKWEWKLFLMKIEIDENSNFPFLDNFFASKEGEKWSLYQYFNFLKMEIEIYINTIHYGEIDFCTFLNRRHPITVAENEEDSKLNKLDKQLRKYDSDSEISVESVLEMIQQLKDE